MPRVTDPALLQQLGTPAPGPVYSAPPKPPAGYGPSGMPSVSYQPGGPEDPAVIAAQARAKAEAEAAARFKADQRLKNQQSALEHENAVNAPITADKRAEFSGDLKALDVLQMGVDRLKGFNTQYFQNQGVKTPLEYAPAFIRPENGVFNDTSGGLSAFVARALNLTGQQFNTPDEQRLFIGSILPKASDTDAQINNKLSQLQAILDNGREVYKTKLGQFAPPDKPATSGAMPVGAAPPTGPGAPGAPPGGFSPNSPAVMQTESNAAPDQITVAQGATRIERDPTMAGVNDKIRGMIGSNRSAAEIVAYMNAVRPGLGDENAAEVAANVQFRQRHPEIPPSNYTVNVERRMVPMSAGDQAWNAVAQSPVTIAGANSFNALTAGAAPSLTSTPELNQTRLDAVSAMHPSWALGGTVLGGGLAGAGLEGAAARLGAGRFAPLAADILYGGASGFNAADPGHGLEGAALGALTGIGGGVAGRKVARGLGKAATGVRDESVRYLNDRGIPLTAGQIISQSGVLGRFAKRAEDTFAGLPGVGDIVNARRTEGFQGLNRVAFDQGLAPIGASTNGVIGAQGVDLARAARSRAYNDVLDPVSLSPDPTFNRDYMAAVMRGRDLPEDMATRSDFAFKKAGENVDRATNTLSGRGYQQGVRQFRRAASENSRLPNGYDLGNVMRQGEDAFEGLLSRQSPQTIPAYQAANEANRNVEVLRDAVNRARNGSRTGETDLFAPSQLADAAAASARKFGNNHGTTNQPFFELSRHAQTVLPSKISDSGTAGRLALLSLPAALGGIGGGYGAASSDGDRMGGARSGAQTGIGLGALIALGGTRGGQQVLARALLDRPDAFVRVGDTLINRSRVAGMFGRPLAVGLLGYQGSGN